MREFVTGFLIGACFGACLGIFIVGMTGCDNAEIDLSGPCAQVECAAIPDGRLCADGLNCAFACDADGYACTFPGLRVPLANGATLVCGDDGRGMCESGEGF